MSGTQQEIEQAMALARQGKSKVAIALLSKIIQRDASNVEAWLAMAAAVEEPDRVEFCLQKVLDLDPGNVTALEELSKIKGGSASGRPSEDALQEQSDTGAGRATQHEQAARDEYRGAAAAVGPESSQGSPDAPEQDEAILARLQETAAEPASAQTAARRSVQPEAAQPAEQVIAQGSQLLSSLGRTDLILIGLTVLAGLVLCGLVGAAAISRSRLFSGQPTESPDDVVQVVFDNIIAANREDLGAYMSTIHPNNPGYDTTQITVEGAFSHYDLSYEIFIPELIEQGRSEAVISYVLTTRRVRGPAFQDNRVTGEMTLRKHEGEWKIYNQRVDDVQHLN